MRLFFVELRPAPAASLLRLGRRTRWRSGSKGENRRPSRLSTDGDAIVGGTWDEFGGVEEGPES